MAIYLNVLLPIRRISVVMQQEIYDPVKDIHRIEKLTWTTAKRVIIFDDALSKEGSHLTNYHRLMSDLKID